MSEENKIPITTDEDKTILILMSYDKLIKILISFENNIMTAKKILAGLDATENRPEVKALLDKLPGQAEHDTLGVMIRNTLNKVGGLLPDISNVLNINEDLAKKALEYMGLTPEDFEQRLDKSVATKKKGNPDSNLN